MEKTLENQLLEFQKRINVIKKDGKNPHFKNTYATLTQILSEVKPILNELGILLTQPIQDNSVKTIVSYNGTTFESIIPLPTNLQPQQLGSAITYYRRYTLASLLSLEIDDDDAQLTVKIVPTSKPKLNSEQFEAMIKAINEGNKVEVQQAMNKYEISEQYLTALNLAIKNN